MNRFEKKIENAGKRFEEFVNQQEGYKLLSKYQGSSKNVNMKHELCNTEFEIRPDNFYKGDRCPKCRGTRISKSLRLDYNEVKSRIEKENYTLLSDTYVNSKEKIKIKHNFCGHEYEVSFNNFNRGRRCPLCANKARTKFLKGGLNESKACSMINDYLIKNNIEFKKEFIFDDLVSTKNCHLRFDYAVFKNGLLCFLIEYDGEQHFKSWKSGRYADDSFKRLQENDNLKNEYCTQNEIILYRIDYQSYNKNTLISDLDLIFKEENYWGSTTIETNNKGVE